MFCAKRKSHKYSKFTDLKTRTFICNVYRACQYIKNKLNVDIIIADDGLQHYKMPRNYEIAIIYGNRGFGNGLCLPAGPLREPVSILSKLNAVLCSEYINNNHKDEVPKLYNYVISALQPVKIIDKTTGLQPQKVYAVAAIGNPEKFFNSLKCIGMELITHVFPDHYSFKQQDINFDDNLPVIMTEKDAVKCVKFVGGNNWVLPILAHLPAELLTDILKHINKN